MGKFLRICFGCHARPDRSFFWHGKQFPICARCTGELIGIVVGIPWILWRGRLSIPVLLLFMAPLVCDGFLQLLTRYESGNIRRVITGCFFGIAFDSAFVYFHIVCISIATEIVKLITGQPELAEAVMKRFL